MGDGQIKAWGRQSRLFMMETDKKKKLAEGTIEREREQETAEERDEREKVQYNYPGTFQS